MTSLNQVQEKNMIQSNKKNVVNESRSIDDEGFFLYSELFIKPGTK